MITEQTLKDFYEQNKSNLNFELKENGFYVNNILFENIDLCYLKNPKIALSFFVKRFLKLVENKPNNLILK